MAYLEKGPRGRKRSRLEVPTERVRRYSVHNEIYSYDEVDQITSFLKSKTSLKPTVGIICGSGLGGLADTLEDQVVIQYNQIPNFPQSTGKICLGYA